MLFYLSIIAFFLLLVGGGIAIWWTMDNIIFMEGDRNGNKDTGRSI